MIYLIDKKLMPGNGLFRFKLLDVTEFTNVVQVAMQANTLDCRIFNPETLDVLKEMSNIDIPLCPISKADGQIELNSGDALLSAAVMFQESVIETAMPINPNTQPQGQIIVNVIMATHYDFSPQGLVDCVIDTQIASQLPKNEWFTEFRDLLIERMPDPEKDTDAKETPNIVQIM